MTSLLLAAGLLAGVAPVEPPDAAARTLVFPGDRAVGALYVRPRRSPDDGADPDRRLSAYGDEWAPLGEARGTVAVPADHEVRLVVSQAARGELSFLAELPADGLFGLNLGGFDEPRVTDDGLRRLSGLTGLRLLNLDGAALTDAAAPHLAKLTGLRAIRLSAFAVSRDGFGVGDATAAALADLPELERLSARDTRIGDAGVAALARSESLRELGLENTAVTDAGLTALAGMKRLESLSFGVYQDGAAITDEGLANLAGAPNLRSLNLTGTQVTDAGLRRLAELPALRELGLGNTGVTAAGLEALSELSKLERLDLGFGFDVDDAAAATLAKNSTSLRTLTARLEVTDAGVAALATLPHLETLSLSGEGVTDAGVRAAAAMPNLTELELRRCPVTDDGLAALAGTPTLARLWVSDTNVNGDGLAALADLPNLERLFLDLGSRDDRFHADRPGLGGVGALRSLKVLNLHGSGLVPDDLAALNGLSNLEFLQIGGVPIDDVAAWHLAGLTTLESLSVDDGGSVTDVGLGFLTNLRNLEHLDLNGAFTGEGVRELAALPRLERVFLSSPYLTDADLDALSAAVPGLTTARRSDYRVRLPIGRASPYRPDPLRPDRPGYRRKAEGEERAALDALEGGPPPPLTVENWLNADGESHALADLHGRVVLVDFWGVWCGPCLAAMPELKALHERHAEDGLTIVGVHTSSAADRMAEFVADEALRWPNAADVDRATTDAWRVPHYPSLYLIDRAGRLRFAGLHRSDLERAVADLLAENEPDDAGPDDAGPDDAGPDDN